MDDTELLKLVLMAGGPSGAAWVAVKAALNGTVQNVKDIKADVSKMREHLDAHGNRLTALETKDHARD